MSTSPACQRCGTPLEPATGNRPRKWCSDRCRKAAPRRQALPADDPIPPGSSVVENVDGLLATLAFELPDPRAVIASVARRLAVEMDRAPSASTARELRSQLEWLVEKPNEEAGFIDEIRARHATRRLGVFLGTLAEPGAMHSRRR